MVVSHIVKEPLDIAGEDGIHLMVLPCFLYVSDEWAIYGLKQAGRQWYKKLDSSLQSLGFERDCPCASSLLLSPSTNYGHAILITLTLLRPTIALPYIALNIPTIEVLLFTMDHDLQENYYPLSCLRGRTPGS